jgi:hypothetical protein
MRLRPSEIRAAMTELMREFDPALYSVADAEAMVEIFADIERMGGHAKALCAARVASKASFKDRDDRSAAAWLSRTAKMSTRDAAAALADAKKLADSTVAARAAREGRLSDRQAADIADAAAGDASVEAKLVRIAEQEGVDAAKRAASEQRARADGIDADRRRARRCAERGGLPKWLDTDGVAHLRWSGNAVDLGELDALLHPFAVKTGLSNPAKALARGLLDALRAAPAPTVRGPKATATIRVDAAALVRG